MYRQIANPKMNTYKCPKCDTEFTQGTKFCEDCGCNLEVEFIETPMCPKCEKTFPTGTVFCKEDGTKLVSHEKMIPKCVKCETVYTDGTTFCPLDGGKVVPEALRTKIDFDNVKEVLSENTDKFKKAVQNSMSSISTPKITENSATPVGNRYPILRLLSTVYRVIAWIIVVIVPIAAAITFASLGRFTDGGGIIGFLGGLVAGAIAGALIAIPLFAISEAIKVFIDIEHNTRLTATRLASKKED